ncbi:IPT/TIG domain-containing protein [Streptomyces sp. NPDC093149]|uniref:IPT/TIG domain-containing protein n=1 Tax=Streptomyces sp. NPDC093149 TaxID=3366031 RepID=UPI0038066687
MLGPGALRRSPYVPSENKERCTCLSPNQGDTGGGTMVTITATNLPNTTKVEFGSKPAAGFTQVSPTRVTAVSPSGMGTVGATVTAPYPGATPPGSGTDHSHAARRVARATHHRPAGQDPERGVNREGHYGAMRPSSSGSPTVDSQDRGSGSGSGRQTPTS